MAEFLDCLPQRDRRRVEKMAHEGGSTAEAIAKLIVREYLNLADNAKDALPKNNLRSLAIRTKNVRL